MQQVGNPLKTEKQKYLVEQLLLEKQTNRPHKVDFFPPY